MIKICEIFDSIQGEGIYSGVFCTFVRLHGCNLQCKECDTKYSFEKNEYKEYSPEDLYNLIKNKNMVILTGGEPLLQYNELKPVICNINNIHIETNGTIFIEDDNIKFWSVSPKLQTFSGKKFLSIESLKNICDKYYDKLQLKFVITEDQDIIGVKYILSELPICKEKRIPVILQPNGNFSKYTFFLKKYIKLVDLLMLDSFLKEYNIRCLFQLHKLFPLYNKNLK